MNSRAINFLFILHASICLSVTGCSMSSPPVKYYSLVDANHPPLESPKNEGLSIMVGPVTLADALNKSQIAIGGKDGVYQRSEVHRWVGSLGKELARAVAEQLAANLGTENIVMYPGPSYFSPNWQVAMDIIAINGDLGEDASLTVRWSLIDPEVAKQPLVRRSMFRQVLKKEGGYDDWVMAQRTNVRLLGLEISDEIRKQGR